MENDDYDISAILLDGDTGEPVGVVAVPKTRRAFGGFEGFAAPPSGGTAPQFMLSIAFGLILEGLYALFG